MKRNIISNKCKAYVLASLFVGISTLPACNPLEDVDTPKFEVYTDKEVYEVGEGVIFNLGGNPDVISFYSGESGSDYDYINKDRILEARAELSFQTQVRSQSGPAGYCQEDQFSIYISNDFIFERNAGQDSVSAVQKATWREITSLFTICPLECSSNTQYKFSELVDISDLFEDGKSLHLAFRYKNRPYIDFGNGNIWRFSALIMNAVTAAGSVPLTTQNTANWMPVFIGEGWTPDRFGSTKTVVTMRGPSTNDKEQELWCVSEPCVLGDTNLGEDKAVGIKSAMDIALTSYQHTFKEPGTYNVTFVARNSNIYDQKERIKQIKITVINKE